MLTFITSIDIKHNKQRYDQYKISSYLLSVILLRESKKTNLIESGGDQHNKSIALIPVSLVRHATVRS